MKCIRRWDSIRRGILVVGLALATSASALAVTTSTVTFQRGVNGYENQLLRISAVDPQPTPSRDGTDGNVETTYLLIDGYSTDDPETPAIEPTSSDEQALLSFPAIIGSNAGQIPQNATILDAKLTHRTYTSGGTPPSGGPFGVAALLQPFTTATRYADFSSALGPPPTNSRGAWFQDGYATRATGGFAGSTATGTLGGIANADVWPLVQGWANAPSTNHGFVIQAGWNNGADNGWGFFANGAPNVADRPKLSVTYTTDPIQVSTFQRDLNGYTGDTSARIASGANLTDPGDDVTLDGTAQTGVLYIDGNEASADQRLRGLMKFDDVFGAGVNQAPADKSVVKAWLVLTTGTGNAHWSPGGMSVHTMLRDWDVTNQQQYSGFGATPGLQEVDGDVSAPLDTNVGMINGSESWFDVTAHMENVRLNPEDPDYGFAITPVSNNGWAINWSGNANVAIRPRLVIYSDLSAPPAGVPGDFNDDDVVDAADYVTWRKADGTVTDLPNDNGLPTPVGGDHYTLWKTNFGDTPGGSGSGAVPEPASMMLGAIAVLGMSFFGSRRRSA